MPIAVGFPRLIAELEKLYQPPFGAKATFRKIRQALEEVARFGRISRVDRISPGALADWLAAPETAGRSRATRRTLLSSLRRACSYAVGRGYLRESPFAFRSLADWLGREELDENLEPEPKKLKHKSIEDLARVLALLESESSEGLENLKLFAAFATLAYTGARAREALGAKVADFDLPGRIWRIRPNERRRLKTRSSSRLVPIPEALAGPLGDWLAVPAGIGPWAFPGPTGVGPWIHGAHGYRALDKIKAAGIRAGVPGMTLQSLRHSFITHSTRWGIANEDVRKLAGHTSERTTQGYRGYDREDMRVAAERIRFTSNKGGSIDGVAV